LAYWGDNRFELLTYNEQEHLLTLGPVSTGDL
jgi:hypothetical protein